MSSGSDARLAKCEAEAVEAASHRGVDELVTYHYLICEVYRVVPPSKLPYEKFWKMSNGGTQNAR